LNFRGGGLIEKRCSIFFSGAGIRGGIAGAVAFKADHTTASIRAG
jgi:hypothetical protein